MSPVILLALAPSALAQDAVSMQVVRIGQVGQSTPGLVLTVNTAADDLSVDVSCGGATANYRGGAEAGKKIELLLQTNPGTYTCSGTLSGRFEDGSEGQMPLSFQIEMLEQLKIEAVKEAIDLAGHKLQVVLDRPAQRIDLEAYGPGGSHLGTGSSPDLGRTPPGSPIQVEWSQGPGDVVKMEVTGFDTNGFWAKLDLFPWFYEIPHEDVTFETNKADIRPSEVGKLDDALAEVKKVQVKYGADVPVNLYVAGYTDTVGDTSQNLWLSEKRAASIATWFKNAGFSGHIYYQGFGEKGQAVATPNEVDEERNRRAVYIVAADAPPLSEQILASAWKKSQ